REFIQQARPRDHPVLEEQGVDREDPLRTVRLRIEATDQLPAVQYRQHEIAVTPFRRGGIALERVIETKPFPRPPTVPYHRVERRQQGRMGRAQAPLQRPLEQLV